MTEAIYNIIIKTGIIFFPLFILGFIAWYYIIKTYLFIKNEEKNSIDLKSTIKEIDYSKIEQTAVNEFILTIQKNKSSNNLKSEIRRIIIKKFSPVIQNINLIKIIAVISPLLGLLGTVNGMIETFKIISYYGNSNPILMASGISKALLTTQAGLTVAFPIMFMSVILKNKLDKIKDKLNKYYWLIIKNNDKG